MQRSSPGLAKTSALQYSKRVGYKLVPFRCMSCRIAHRGCRRGRAASIYERYTLRQRAFELVADKMPCAVILGLFLRPDDLTQKRESPKRFAQ